MIISKQTTVNQLKKILMIYFTWCVTLIIASQRIKGAFFRNLKTVIALLLLNNLNFNSALVRTVQNRPQMYSFNCTVIKFSCFLMILALFTHAVSVVTLNPHIDIVYILFVEEFKACKFIFYS